jgi:hypothetical protein
VEDTRVVLKRPPEAGEILQGTLDMLILRTLVIGPAHGHTIAQAIERTSENALEVEEGSLIQPFIVSKTVAGFQPNGALAKTTAEPSSTGSPPGGGRN